jgi:hypothetical protein
MRTSAHSNIYNLRAYVKANRNNQCMRVCVCACMHAPKHVIQRERERVNVCVRDLHVRTYARMKIQRCKSARANKHTYTHTYLYRKKQFS